MSGPRELRGLRAALHDPGRQLLGTFVIVPRVEVVETVASAGYDLVVLDCEHGPFGVDALLPLVAAAQGTGMYAVVRVPGAEPQQIGAALDCGADGVLVPHVGCGAAAAGVVAASRFPPQGDRSVHLWVRAARYGSDTEYLGTANDGVAVLAMVEGAEAHARLDEITGTEGLDAVFVGPMDLAASLGLAATPYDPRVFDAAADIVRRADAAGRATSIFAPHADAARRWLEAGVRLVVMSVDTALMRNGFTDAARTARGDAAAQPQHILAATNGSEQP
jgi:2-keto-3-deoxy-L-rhamnonate aldolase RhmA